MARLKLSSKTRTDLRKSELKKLRREGGVPATIYGKGEESRSVAIQAEDFKEILKTPGGRLALIDLKVDGTGSKAHPVMIQTIQRDPISKDVVHVDFHQVSMNEPVTASVPVTLTGDAPGVKEGGILEQITREVEVKALPDHIPTYLGVEISHLDLGDSVHVSDISLEEGVEITNPTLETIVAVVRMPIVHIEEEAEAKEAVEGEEASAEAEETTEES